MIIKKYGYLPFSQAKALEELTPPEVLYGLEMKWKNEGVFENDKFKKGEFKIKNTIHLPQNMTKGEYILGISLHQPNIELYLNIPETVRLIVKGIIGVSGLDFEYKDNGFLILE